MTKDDNPDAQGKAVTMQLGRVLSLVADSAIAADDAIKENDANALDRAINALTLNADTAKRLAQTWRAAR